MMTTSSAGSVTGWVTLACLRRLQVGGRDGRIRNERRCLHSARALPPTTRQAPEDGRAGPLRRVARQVFELVVGATVLVHQGGAGGPQEVQPALQVTAVAPQPGIAVSPDQPQGV